MKLIHAPFLMTSWKFVGMYPTAWLASKEYEVVQLLVYAYVSHHLPALILD